MSESKSGIEDMEKIVCLTGHRMIAPDRVLTLPDKIEAAVRALAAEGARTFRAGGAIGFDTLGALKILELREKLGLRLILYLPCENQTRGWSDHDVRAWQYVRDHADEVKVLAPHYYDGCMLERDRQMVTGADVCLAYYTGSGGGTAFTVKYALRNGLKLINLFE